MNKICTSIEQSQKLIELGISLDTADMYHAPDANIIMAESYITKAEDETLIPAYKRAVPAWSLSSLINLLPSEFTEVGKYSTTTYVIKIRKYKLTDKVNLYQIAYGSYKWHKDEGYTSWSDMIDTGEKEELLDAAFEMVCWLLENKKI